MARIANSLLFRAQAAQLNWAAILQRLDRVGGVRIERLGTVDPRLIKEHSNDVRLAWSCSQDLGVPLGPFTVWTRPRRDDKLDDTRLSVSDDARGVLLEWAGIEASCVDVAFDVVDQSKPVGLMLVRAGGTGLPGVVAATAVVPAGPTVELRLRCSGATSAVLVNGRNPSVRIERLQDTVNDPAWQPLEIVGLPVDQPWGGTAYDARDQGPVGALTDPVDAALDRLNRGGPIVGWAPVTQTGQLAPPWQPPDYKALVEEVRKTLLPEIPRLYDAGIREWQQHTIVDTRVVDAPQQGGRSSSLDTSADVAPWGLLMLPALSDPFLNLATGFGSAYVLEKLGDRQLAVGTSDFLVTADYEHLMPPFKGPAEMAAYCPRPGRHLLVPDPTGVTAVRSGLVAPPVADLAWAETVVVSWDRLEPMAGTASVTESNVARFDPGSAAPAVSLLPPRDSGGLRPFVVTPASPDQNSPLFRRTAVSDVAAEIALGSGGRNVGYATAVSDVFGVWSDWRDVAYIGGEPGPELPRVVSLELTSTFAGSSSCPARLKTQLSVEWAVRTPDTVEAVALFFPMSTAKDAPPAGLSPDLPVPAGCFRRDLSISFAGDVPVPAGCTVVSLTEDGTEEILTPGPAQGDGGRRYELSADLMLDFSATGRWGVQLFARRSLLVGPSPTGWSPTDPTHPAVTSAASPVPVTPIPPPAPPGVPLGSMLDAQGCSHVRVHWALPGGADVRTCVVWEISETALRTRCGLAARQDTDSPGVRLAQLWTAYDAMTDTQRRNAFRRIQELPGTARDVDIALPKGSTDIHLFVVTTATPSGVESPWPAGPGDPHEHLQAVIAPRPLRPGPPLARPSVAEDGTVTIELSSPSTVPVRAFRLLRTPLENAARSADTMGPPFAEVPVDSPTPAATDAVTGQPVFTATWTGMFPASWDRWLVRSVALAVDTVPVEGVRGLPSIAGDVVALYVPPAGPPDLAPLTYEVGADPAVVVVRSSTSAPARALPAGSHLLSAEAGAQTAAPSTLESLAETDLTIEPPAAAADVVLERGARASGRSPLAVWFTRPDATAPVDVTVRLRDPLGRVTEQTVTVPGFVPPPPVELEVLSTVAIAGRGVGIELRCDADAAAEPPFVMHVRAMQHLNRRPRLSWLPDPGLIRILGRSLSGTFPLDTIPTSALPLHPGIQVVRRESPGHGLGNYAVWVPLVSPVDVAIDVTAPDGAVVTVTTSV